MKARFLKEISARYLTRSSLGLQSDCPNIWDQRAKALLAHNYNIPPDVLQSWERLTRYLTGRYVPGFSLKASSKKKHGAPVEWDHEQLAQLFADVEFLKKNTGKSISKICEELSSLTGYVKRWGRYRGKSGGLRKAYAKAKIRHEILIFELLLCGPDALIPEKRTDLIQAAIERHALQQL